MIYHWKKTFSQQNATYFYEEAPWRICSPSHVVCIQAFGQTRVAQLVGMSDSTNVGLALWNNYESFKVFFN